jgi:hypothetical protein
MDYLTLTHCIWCFDYCLLCSLKFLFFLHKMLPFYLLHLPSILTKKYPKASIALEVFYRIKNWFPPPPPLSLFPPPSVAREGAFFRPSCAIFVFLMGFRRWCSMESKRFELDVEGGSTGLRLSEISRGLLAPFFWAERIPIGC